MPAGNRIRTNNVFGATTDNPLTAGAGAFNSPQLALMPVISSAHAVVTLDPLRQFGEPEIVIITAHTAAATTATITRGAYGTSARQHPVGTIWVHAPIDEDVTEIVTSSTRPSNPYEGQMIYETDTDSYKGYNGSAWEHGLTLGAWLSWTPTLTNLTIGNGTIQARYSIVGRTVNYRMVITLGGTSTVGSDIFFSLPVTAAAADTTRLPIGNVMYEDVSLSNFFGMVWQADTVRGRFLTLSGSNPPIAAGVTTTVPFTWTTGDKFSCTGFYEAAT